MKLNTKQHTLQYNTIPDGGGDDVVVVLVEHQQEKPWWTTGRSYSVVGGLVLLLVVAAVVLQGSGSQYYQAGSSLECQHPPRARTMVVCSPLIPANIATLATATL